MDTKKLMVFIKRIQSDKDMREKYLVLNCPWVNVDDSGKPFAIFDQDRVFRNLPHVRYVGRIHEKLDLTIDDVVRVDEINIIHTGYSKSAHDDTSKAERNIELLRTALEENPDDLNIKGYLADSLGTKSWTDGPDGAKSAAEAESLFQEVIDGGPGVYPMLRKKAYLHFITKYVNDPEKKQECEELCQRALSVIPGDIDLEYYYAVLLNNKGEHREAWDLLTGCEAKLSAADIDVSIIVSANPSMLFGQMVLAAQALKDVGSVVKYATLILSADKSLQGILAPYIFTLLSHGTSEDDVIEVLAKIYDLSDPGDLLLIARAAKDCGALGFARRIMGIAAKIMQK